MSFQPVITIVHILSAVVWLGYVPADLVLRGAIRKNQGMPGERKLVSAYLQLTNIAGIIGMSGLLLTGIILVSALPYYFFFSFASNHWLAGKQVIMVVLIVLVFAFLIPKARKVRTSISAENEKTGALSSDLYNNLKSLETIVTIINVLVFINFLLAMTNRVFRLSAF